MKNIFIISNGKGEDSISVTVLKQLDLIIAQEGFTPEECNVLALPLVDDGSAYKKNGYITAATWKALPSNGFGFSGLWCFLRDVRHGLFGMVGTQLNVVKKETKSMDIVVTFGDIVPFLMAAFWGGKPIIHVGTAMTSYVRPYSWLEMWLFRKYSKCVVCRDELTALHLRKHGVNGVYYGNPMMDDPLLTDSQKNLGIEKKKKHLVLVPSSREDAYINTLRMLKLIKKIGRRTNYSYVLSLAPNLNLAQIVNKAQKAGWKYDALAKKGSPLVGVLSEPSANNVQIVNGYFRECLDGATAVFGMTGTGNEQIAGLGVPVVLLRGKSQAASGARMRHYKKLLGDAVFIPSRFNARAAKQIVELLDDPKFLTNMGEVGLTRMGPSGGAYNIARKIFYYLFNKE